MLWYFQASTPKRGNSASEYEDAFDGDLKTRRWAVADGAAESSFADAWARALVKGFVRSPAVPPQQWDDWLPPLQRQWAEEVGGRPLPWYAEVKFEQGAFAAFLGLTLGRRRWRAVAVGDSCLFLVRGGRLQRSFPVTRSDEFSNNPWLVSSRASPEDARVRRAHGRWREGDLLLLMTDALAQWFLKQHEVGKRPWEPVLDLLKGPAPAEEFGPWVEGLRESRELRNDDVTVIAIEP